MPKAKSGSTGSRRSRVSSRRRRLKKSKKALKKTGVTVKRALPNIEQDSLDSVFEYYFGHYHASPERQAAALMIGVPISAVNSYLSDVFNYGRSTKRGETYSRSVRGPGAKLVTSQHALMDDARGIKAAHLGLYRNIFEALTREMGGAAARTPKGRKHVKPTIRTQGGKGGRLLYDVSLTYRSSIAGSIAGQVGACVHLDVGCYHAYPCVMVHLKPPEARFSGAKKAAWEGWVEFVLSYFVGMVNCRAWHSGYDIELTRRSSFGAVTPTVAPTGASFRLNVGIIPKGYAKILADSLKMLDSVLGLLYAQAAASPPGLPEDCFLDGAENLATYNDYFGAGAVVPPNLWGLLWAKTERGSTGKTTIWNLTRQAIFRDYLAAETAAQIQEKIDARSAVTSAVCAEILWDLIKLGVGKVKIADGSMGVDTAGLDPKARYGVLKLAAKAKTVPDARSDKGFAEVLRYLLYSFTLSRASRKIWRTEDEIKTSIGDIVDNAGGGDCLFHAVLDMLPAGHGLTHMTLRQSAVQVLQDYQGELAANWFRDRLTLRRGGSQRPNTAVGYFRLMRKKGTWGGALEVQALAIYLNKPIMVLAEGLSPQAFDRDFTGATLTGTPLVLYYRDGNHYMRVRPRAGETAHALYARIKTLPKRKKIVKTGLSFSRLYDLWQRTNEHLFIKALEDLDRPGVDPYGSDSDEEGEHEDAAGAKTKLFAQKVIVCNGMRAIVRALEATHQYLAPKSTDPKPKLVIQSAYYELSDARSAMTKKFSTRRILESAEVIFHDLNPCVTDGSSASVTLEALPGTVKVAILDATSATTAKQHEWVEKFVASGSASVLMFVSSGFKNEQMGADKNPYGTVRVFAKDRDVLKAVMCLLKDEPDKDSGIHSRVSHAYRRALKGHGAVPTNALIFRPNSTSKADVLLEEVASAALDLK